MNVDDAKRFGWKVEKIIGKRKVVRLLCPFGEARHEVQRDDVQRDEGGNMIDLGKGCRGPAGMRLNEGAHVGLMHVQSHRFAGGGGMWHHALRALEELAGALSHNAQYQHTHETGELLKALGFVLKPHAPHIADELESLVPAPARAPMSTEAPRYDGFGFGRAEEAKREAAARIAGTIPGLWRQLRTEAEEAALIAWAQECFPAGTYLGDIARLVWRDADVRALAHGSTDEKAMSRTEWWHLLCAREGYHAAQPAIAAFVNDGAIPLEIKRRVEEQQRALVKLAMPSDAVDDEAAE